MALFKISAVEKVPQCIATYVIEEIDEDIGNELIDIVPNFWGIEVFIKTKFDFPVQDLEVDVENKEDYPTEGNENNWSLNCCENPEEIFTDIEDFFGIPGTIIDIYSEDETIPETFKDKFREFHLQGGLDDCEFGQVDYEVDVYGRMKVEKID